MEQFSLESLAKSCQNKDQLFNIMFVLLSQCDQNCIHCYIPEHKQAGLSTDKVKSLIDEARNLGALNVTFTGGEILLRKDLLELIAYARSKYMRVFLMSNGYSLTEEYCKKLGELYISGFSTTIFSMNSDIHDRITQKPGSLHRVLGNIEYLKQYCPGCEITIKTPLMDLNRFEYRDVQKYAESNGFTFRSSPSIFGKTDGDDAPHQLEVNECDLPVIVKETDEINSVLLGNIFKQDGDVICSAGHSNICVNFTGDVWPCNTLTMPVGNVFENTLKEIWNASPKLMEWRRISRKSPDVCGKCQLASKCVRCPGLAYMENNDINGCSTTAKRIAVARHKE